MVLLALLMSFASFATIASAQLVPVVSVKDKISTKDLNECYGTGVQRARVLFSTEWPVFNKLNLTDAPVNVADISGEAKPLARDSGYYAAIVEGTVRCLTAKFNLSVIEVKDLVDMALTDSLLGKSCLIPEDEVLTIPAPKVHGVKLGQSSMLQIVENSIDPNNWCLTYPYRTATGYCNNPVHPEWGSSFRPFKRFLPPDYDDGIGSPRARSKKSGNQLPLARLVSRTIHQDVNRAHRIATHMVMQWGQFQDHDVTHTPQVTDSKGRVPVCCPEHAPPGAPHNPECFPVIIPEDDFFAKHGTKCLELARSMPTTRAGCRLGPREQINQVTSFVDASQVYGSTERELNYLRSFKNGRLRSSAPNPHGGQRVAGSVANDIIITATANDTLSENLPEDAFLDDCVNGKNVKGVECLRGGDVRVNEQAGLASMHTLWMRQHNLVAEKLQAVNPHWDDERLFQEARRIVGAMAQRITYAHWLPVILGPTIMRAYDMNVLNEGYASSYNISQDPTVANVIAAVAHRFGHTLIQGNFQLRNPHTGEFLLITPLRKTFNQPYRLVNSHTIDQMIMGMCMQRAQTFDRFMDQQITNHLLEDPPGKDGAGQDLMSRNIQRARDHGIPSYTHWRAACGLEVPRDFEHLKRMDIMGDDAPALFEKLYETVEDIDPFPGIMSEKPLADGVLGPTVACLIANQFRRLKVGDRFWHENGLAMPSSFSPAQLREIRKITLARVVCDTANTISHVQPNVFLAADVEPNNNYKPCAEIVAMDFNAWREDPSDAQTIEAMRVAMSRKPAAPYTRPILQGNEGNNVEQAQQQSTKLLTEAQKTLTSPLAPSLDALTKSAQPAAAGSLTATMA